MAKFRYALSEDGKLTQAGSLALSNPTYLCRHPALPDVVYASLELMEYEGNSRLLNAASFASVLQRRCQL